MIIKKLDTYIIKKFLGAFILSIVLIISIAIVFDISEKLDDFVEHNVTVFDIATKYYLNFIPYFVNMFAPLFTFISVILFTSKLAENTEIIAILSAGISYRRLMVPYLISAALIAAMTFSLNSWVIPPSNKERLDFLETLKSKKRAENVTNMQMEIQPGVILTIKDFNKTTNTGFNASLDKFNDKKELISRTTANTIKYDTLNHWTLNDCIIRNFDGLYEHLEKKTTIDTTLKVEPDEFFIYAGMEEQMTNHQLKRFIERQKNRGVGNIKAFEIEYAKRFASPMAAFILTVIGLGLSSKKVRGGMGANLGIGLLLSFTYIMFFTVSSTFAVNGTLSPVLASWLPNIVYTFIAAFVYHKAQK